MKKTSGKPCSESSGKYSINLLPYPIIAAAVKGDCQAMETVIKHFNGYISKLSLRKLRDEYGNYYYGIDKRISDRICSRLIQAILSFKI